MTNRKKDKCKEFVSGAAAAPGESGKEETVSKEQRIDIEQENAVESEEISGKESSQSSIQEKLEKELADSKDKYLRIQAEFQNYRKRVAKEMSAARVVGQVDAIIPFLQVFDHFHMAVAASDKAENMDAIKDGLKMILAEFSKAIEELGIEKIDATGKDFDPNLHEAMANEESEEHGEGKVIKQWACGYRMGERLLRAANVVVSSGRGKNSK